MSWTHWLMFLAGTLTGLALSALVLAAFWHRWRIKNLDIVFTQMADTEKKLMKTKRFAEVCVYPFASKHALAEFEAFRSAQSPKK